MFDDTPFMQAARARPAARVPVWLMRQAGRYMPEYRALRGRCGFLELCRNPALAAEVAIHAAATLGVDAAILFSDLLVLLEPLGIPVTFAAGEGPVLPQPLRTPADVDRVGELADPAPLDYVLQAVRLTRAGLPPTVPLLGFAGAPFTLASYAIEGGSSRTFQATKAFMYADPGAWNELLGRLTRSVAVYLRGQIDAGAQAVQVFDSWAGCLGPADYRRYVLPHTKTLFESLPADVPAIHFATGNPALLPLLREAGGTVFGLDWRVDLPTAWHQVGHDRAVQGNLDPAVLLADPAVIRREVARVLKEVDGRPGFIFNLGHGVLPQTPVANAIALVEAVHELGR